MKALWHDGVGMSLYVKRLEHGRFIWPTPADGAVAISAAQLGYLFNDTPETVDILLSLRNRAVKHVDLRTRQLAQEGQCHE